MPKMPKQTGLVTNFKALGKQTHLAYIYISGQHSTFQSITGFFLLIHSQGLFSLAATCIPVKPL